MPSDTVCKTVQQYNQKPIPDEAMRKLLEIAADYREVKNYVYDRFSGIGKLSELYPGYTVQNEMTESSLRSKLNMPSVYFYLAVYDALGDIKSQWTRTKTKVLDSINRNENFTDKEKHYLRFLLKVSNVFEAVLSYRPITLKDEIQKRYELLAQNVDTKRLHNYLRRQVRKCRTKLHTDMADGFSISERAYRYADHGIYISTKEKRKRVFVPLTDNNRYSAQLYIKLYPEQGKMEIKVPVRVKVRSHSDYMNHVGLSVGIFTMLTTDKGNRYGERLGEYQIAYADWIRKQTGSYNRNREQNPGRKKYRNKKRR